MRTTKTNGAATRRGNLTATSQQPSYGECLAIVEADVDRREREAQERVEQAGREITIRLDPATYGTLTAGSVVHGITVEEMAVRYLQSTVADWSNDDYRID
jgi:hypothetical protein